MPPHPKPLRSITDLAEAITALQESFTDFQIVMDDHLQKNAAINRSQTCAIMQLIANSIAPPEPPVNGRGQTEG